MILFGNSYKLSRSSPNKVVKINCRQPITHAMDYLMRDGLQLKNKMKELNKDCFLNTEVIWREKLQAKIKDLSVTLSNTEIPLSTKYRLLYSFYHSLFTPGTSPVVTSLAPSSEAILASILCSPDLPIIIKLDFLSLLTSTRSKLMIPHFEQ